MKDLLTYSRTIANVNQKAGGMSFTLIKIQTNGHVRRPILLHRRKLQRRARRRTLFTHRQTHSLIWTFVIKKSDDYALHGSYQLAVNYNYKNGFDASYENRYIE